MTDPYAFTDIEFCGRAIERTAVTRPRRIRQGSKTARD
jgi:predicted metalloprotease